MKLTRYKVVGVEPGPMTIPQLGKYDLSAITDRDADYIMEKRPDFRYLEKVDKEKTPTKAKE